MFDKFSCGTEGLEDCVFILISTHKLSHSAVCQGSGVWSRCCFVKMVDPGGIRIENAWDPTGQIIALGVTAFAVPPAG